MSPLKSITSVLLIEDDASDAALFQKYLKKCKEDEYQITVVTNLTDSLAVLERQTFDIIVADLTLPDSSELQTVEILRTQFPFMPLLILSARASEMGLAALQRGAQDSIMKGSFNGEQLSTAIQYAMERQRRLADVKAEKSALDLAVSMDTITGLPNRRLFEERLELACKLAKRENRKLALVDLELDDINEARDVFGQKVVHHLARLAADLFRAHSRENDTVARVGDGRFMFILYGLEEDHDARAFSKKILQALKVPVVVNDSRFFLNARVGISLLGCDGETVADLVSAAEKALVTTKEEGRGRIRFSSGRHNVHDLVLSQQEMALRDAFEKGHLRIKYEPQMHLTTGKIFRLQAKISCDAYPGLSVPYEDLLALAESAGVYAHIHDWMFSEICKEIRRWVDLGQQSLSFLVSLPRIRWGRIETIQKIAEALKYHSLANRTCMIEISARTLLDGSERQSSFLTQLRDFGFGIVVPHFGIDTSVISKIRELPIQAIKIDASPLKTPDPAAPSLNVLRALVDLIHSLGLESIAEGIDTEDQLGQIRSLGCHLAQGSLIEKMMSALPLEPTPLRSRFRLSLQSQCLS